MKKEVLIGTVIGLACAGFVLLLPLEMRKDFLLALGALIPAIYVGFSIQGGNVKEIVIQVLGALFFVFLSLFGAWKLPVLLPLAIGLHGFWDLLHHSKHAPMTVKKWYPPFCAVVDWVLGASLLLYSILQTYSQTRTAS